MKWSLTIARVLPTCWNSIIYQSVLVVNWASKLTSAYHQVLYSSCIPAKYRYQLTTNWAVYFIKIIHSWKYYYCGEYDNSMIAPSWLAPLCEHSNLRVTNSFMDRQICQPWRRMEKYNPGLQSWASGLRVTYLNWNENTSSKLKSQNLICAV